jgi:tetratricopeptide (TPR) repeat protein
MSAEPEPSAPTKEQEEELLPALFWDGSEDWINEDNCADFAALQSLKYDDSTPEERAEELKRKGNDALKYKQNKLYVRKAVQQYTLALLESFEDAKLRAVIHGNRAHAALLLGNDGKALEDAKKCVALDPENVKGWFRAAKASLGLARLDECVGHCENGLALEPDNADIKAILKSAKRASVRREEREARLTRVRAETKAYLARVRARRVKLGPPVVGAGEHFPKIEETDEAATYWTLFVYPESMQTDVIECFDERATFREQADEMFGAEAPPLPWDDSGRYSRDRVELYYQSNAAPAYPPEVLEARVMRGYGGDANEDDANAKEKAESWQKPVIDPRDQKMILIDESKTLGEVLAEDECVVPGHPIVYVVAKGTEFREKFLAGEWEL